MILVQLFRFEVPIRARCRWCRNFKSAALVQRRAPGTGCGVGMLLVTGGAGFIGSNVVAGLNEAGRADVAVNDWLGSDGKWRNLQKRQFVDIVPPADLFRWLGGRKLDAVIHLGAISDTTVTDGDAVM